MYLWLIIATFVTAIAGLSISVRHDIDQLYVDPQAQTVITKLYVQHEAAKSYLVDHRSVGPNLKPSFEPGVINFANVGKGYLPFGFNADGGVARFNSMVYCLDSKSADMSTLPVGCGDNCCQADGAKTYLISFGCVPRKWRDNVTGKPLPRLLSAMKTTYGYLNGLGYVVNRKDVNLSGVDGNFVELEPIETSMGILGQGTRYYIPIPNYIINSGLPSAGNDSFSRVCGSGADADDPEAPLARNCKYCLVYMTPF